MNKGHHHINDLDLLEIAFDDGSGSINYIFDRDTGEVISIHEDMFDLILKYATEEDKEDLEYLKEDPYIVFSSDRFVHIDLPPSYEAYNLMVEFVEELENKELFRLLEVALNGKGAFRRFKDVLIDYPEEQQKWYRFKRIDTLRRILEWSQINSVQIKGIEELIDELS